MNISKDINKKSDVNIELLRIICCVFVISIHILPEYVIYDGVLNLNLLVVDSLTRCAVPVFFIITGFFYNPDTSYKTQLSKLLKKILLPTLVCMLFYILVLPYIVGEKNSYNIDTKATIIALVSGRIWEIEYCYHLWYIVDLTKCYLIFPFLSLLFSERPNSKRAQHYFLILGLIGFIIVPSLKTLTDSEIIHNFYTPPEELKWLWYIMVGFFLSRLIRSNDHIIVHKGKSYLYLLGYVLSALFIFICEYYFDYKQNNMLTDKFYIQTFIGILSSSIFLFLWIKNISIKSEFLRKIIHIMGSCTFGIYLIHIAVIRLFPYFENFVSVKYYIIPFIKIIMVFLISFFTYYIFSKLNIFFHKYIR